MVKNVKIPHYIAEGIGDLTRLDKEVLGIVTVNDRDIHPNRDELVSSYLTLEVGDSNSVEGSKTEDKILQEFAEQGDSRHRYFHTHPVGTLSNEGANPEGYSEPDLDTFTENQDFYDDPEHWHLIAYHDRSDSRPGFKLITSGDWNIEFEDWNLNGKGHAEIGSRIYDELIEQGIEEVDPYEQARKIA